MFAASALAAFDAQVRQSTQPDEAGVLVEADGTVVRWIALDDQGQSWIAWSRLDSRTADAVIAAQVEFFRARRQQFEWKLYDYDRPSDLGQRLLAAGFVAGDDELLMVAPAARVAGEVLLPDGVSVREVTDEAGVDQLLDVHERVFGMGEPWLRRSLLARLRDSPESVAAVIALAGEEPICAARVEFPPACDFAGLWGGGTVPGWRGRGIYRALVAYRARLAAARGYRYVQVDARPTSQPILTRLGFSALAHTTPYIWDPGRAAEAPPAWLGTDGDTRGRLPVVELKSPGEIEAMRAAGRVVAVALAAVREHAATGVALNELDQVARSVLADAGATSPFLGYQPSFAHSPFPAVICTSVNDAALHGIPDSYRLRDGDLLSVDCGATLNGWTGDAAVSFTIGRPHKSDAALIETAQAALAAGIAAAVPGGRLGDISAAIGALARSAGYGLHTDFGGHGVGHTMHESPSVPNDGRPGRGLRLAAGLVIAIEPWFMAGGHDSYRVDHDGWTLRSGDGSRAAHVEHTVAITDDGPRILTAP